MNRSISYTLATFFMGGSILLSTAANASGLSRAESVADNRQPAIAYPQQDKAADLKLAEKLKSSGKRPNILWLVVDDLGFGDIGGPWGGGAHIGAATPNIDQMTRNGPQWPGIDLHLFPANLHSDPLGNDARPFTSTNGFDPTHPGGRRDQGKPLERGEQRRIIALWSRLSHHIDGQMAYR